MVWLLNVKLTAEQSTYRAMAYWKLKTGPQLILRLLRTIQLGAAISAPRRSDF